MSTPEDMSALSKPGAGNEPVAIVGMGCRFSGGVKDCSSLWELLRSNRDGWKEFKEPRFPANGFYHPNQDRPGSIRAQGAFLCDDDARQFDHGFFGITSREVETMDPSQRKLLEVVYEAFENAGETWESISGSRTGVYVGMFALDHVLTQSREWDYTRPYAATGADLSILANRISYVFNLHGPSMVTTTACSSSMYALHLAVNAIRSGDCDGAVVASANWIHDPSLQMVLDKLGALSPTSRCHTFDTAADGYARGESFSAIYLKTPMGALQKGMPIRAMIRGTSVNANGKTAGGMTRPSAKNQAEVIRRAYENAGSLPFEHTTFFECHGTGTQAGDPLEVAAIGSVFASSRNSNRLEDRLLIGSVKPNLGHTEGSSALTSIMKVILSLEAGEVAPTYGVQTLNPNIDFDGARVHVVRDVAIPWPKGKTRRASVNSFGFGGANGHCIIDHVNEVLPNYVKPGVVSTSFPRVIGYYQATHNQPAGSTLSNGDGHVNGKHSSKTPAHWPVTSQALKKVASATASTREFVLLPFSAHNESSLELNIAALSQAMMDSTRWILADLAYTLSDKRSRLPQRTFRIVDTEKDTVAAALGEQRQTVMCSIQKSNVAFVFTGQGAQWYSMGAKLFEYGVFRSTVSYLDWVLQELRQDSGDVSSWTIAATLSGDCETGHVQSPHVSQVACTALQLGLVDLLASWSVRPCAVVGHSSGEIGAAYAAGHLGAAEAIAMAYFRGQVTIRNKQKGAMLAVGLGPDQVDAYLKGMEERVCIAAINSPRSVTLSGNIDAVHLVAAALSKDDVFNRLLNTGGSAYHSHHMRAVGGTYLDMIHRGQDCLKNLGLVENAQQYPRVPWPSSVNPGESVANGASVAGPEYWRQNLESPVRFVEAVTRLVSLEDQSVEILVEIGPHSALKGPVEQILANVGRPMPYTTALTRNEDGRRSLLHLAGTLFANNADIDLAAVNSLDAKGVDGETTLVHGCMAVDLPTYQYTYGPISYYESRISKEFRLRDYPRHDLLGSEIPGASKVQPQWRNILRMKDLPWLSDYRLLPDAVLPAAAYIAIAVEAITRTHKAPPGAPEITGYMFRKVKVHTNLRIPEDDYGIEIVFAMTPVHTAAANAPAWAKFAVTSVDQDSGKGTEYCTGLVKVDILPSKPRVQMENVLDPRYPRVAAWYERFQVLGLGYGRTFQALSDLQVDPHRRLAKATVQLNSTEASVEGGESCYILHPAALEAAFHLAAIGLHGGQLERASAAYIPVQISHLYLKSRVQKDVTATAIARGLDQGLRSTCAQLQVIDSTGNVFLEVESVSFKELPRTQPHEMAPEQPFNSFFSRLEWKPDIRTLTDRQSRQVFPPAKDNAKSAAALELIEMICSLVIFDIYDTFIAKSDTNLCPKGEIRHWLAWIEKIVRGDHERVQIIEARKLSPDQRRKLLKQLYNEVGDRAEAQAAQALHESIADIVHERRTGVDVLLSHKLLTPVYEVGTAFAGSHSQVFNIMDALAHVNPSMRILEIGAGTGAATRAALGALAAGNGIKRYADYTFTDISPGFLASAKETFSQHRDMQYSVLDIELDPMEHGYEPVYDIILACEAIHATKSMGRTLANCRSLLKPGGKLVLVETTRMRVLFGLLFGTLTGYWQEDDRTEGPFMSLELWQGRLKAAGFSGVDIHLDDYDAPNNTTSVLVATRVDEEDGVGEQCAVPMTAPVYLLYGTDEEPPLAKKLAVELELRDVKCKKYRFPDASLEQTVPVDSRVIVLLNHQNDLFDPDEVRLQSFQYLARSVNSMVWLTASDKVRGRDPRSAFMAGLLRVIAADNPTGRFLSIDIECKNGNFQEVDVDLIHSIVEREFALQFKVGTGLDDGETLVDSEFAWQDGCMWVSRVVPDTGLNDYEATCESARRQNFDFQPVGSCGPVRAVTETVESLDTPYFRPHTELLMPLPAGHIDVKIAAVGLSRSGAFVAADPTDIDRKIFSDYAGVVTKIGAEVTGLEVGDRVYGVSRGCFGSYGRVRAAFAQKLPSKHGLIESATMPTSFMSAVYAFECATRLRKGCKVLVQNATTGLGLAAIQVARAKGADIFAAADTAEDVSFLVDTVGIPHDNVFVWQDRAYTDYTVSTSVKKSYNVIFGVATSRSQLYQALEMLVPSGHLIVVGDQEGNLECQAANPDAFELGLKNASVTSFDLLTFIEDDTELGRELMERVHHLREMGQITPIHPYHVSDVTNLDQTLLDISHTRPAGKWVVSFENPESMVKIRRQPEAVSFDPHARYIITGGLSGLVPGLIRWMAGRGAQDFIVFARHGVDAERPAAQILLEDMTSSGVQIRTVACDVTRQHQVTQAVDTVSNLPSGRPIKGIVHAVESELQAEVPFDTLTIDQWQTGTAAKTIGTVNMHEATLKHSLDFFVVLGSTDTVWAPVTKAADVAADDFVSSFARYRRRLGLPASIVRFGTVSDLAPEPSEPPKDAMGFRAGEVLAHTITEHQALGALGLAFLSMDTARGARQKAFGGKHHDTLSEADLITCLNPLRLATLSSEQIGVGWGRDGRAALLMRSVSDARCRELGNSCSDGAEVENDRGSKTARMRRAFDEAIDMKSEGRAAAIAVVSEGIITAIAEMLFMDAGNVDAGKSVAEHGVDSLIAAELRIWFRQALGVDLRNLLDIQTSIKELAEGIVSTALGFGEDGFHRCPSSL